VENTLPQARAEISNTGSNRNEGAVYGFFAGEGDGSCLLSLVDLSMVKFSPLLLII
jgi:hypothetical protein